MELATDIELCSVTDVKAKEKLMNALMKAGVPYAEKWEKVSLRKRRQFHRAKEVCVCLLYTSDAADEYVFV